ncbi:ankyrin-3-like [Littorina saxatilis]|uniref:ankyrin-3-like n=1 Tax=Littorina saxatilis TaxID=31220 RepID=UPI0038B646E0
MEHMSKVNTITSEKQGKRACLQEWKIYLKGHGQVLRIGFINTPAELHMRRTQQRTRLTRICSFEIPETSSQHVMMERDSPQRESSKELVRITTLVGASPFCNYPMYSYHGESVTATGKLEDSINDSPVNQLQKEHLVYQKEVFEHYAEGKPIRVWASNTLPWDLNIPMTTSPPPLPNFMQAFVICAERPPLLLSLYGKGEYSADVEDYTRETARLLHWSLLGFCHLDFLVLPCCMTYDELQSFADLEKKVKTEMDVVERYFRSPLLLSEFTFSKLKEATTALVGSTFIPCLLEPKKKTEKMWMLLMDKDWTDRVSRLIESLHKGDGSPQTVSLRKDNLIIALEAAKRISFSGEVKVEYTSDSVRDCLQGLISRTKMDFDVLLQLTDNKSSRTSSQGREMDRLQLETTATELQLKKQRIFNMIIDGQHPQLCKYQLLVDQEFLVSFTDFCKEEHTRVLHVGDMEYGLPLLYWSVAVSSPKLTHWCLQIMEDTVTKPEDLPESMLSAAIAAILFSIDSDEKFQAKSFLKRLTNLKPKLEASQSLKLALPLPRHILSEERITKLKTHFESGAVCYLDDLSLPIPDSLLSVTVTEDAVSVELPSQHWYLTLRLLADREVDETDRDGNTLLHIAADKGNLEAITLAVKSGASLTKTNKYGTTPYQMPHRRIEEYRDDLRSNFYNACARGALEEVKISLCHHVSLYDAKQDENSLHCMAYSYGHKQIAYLLISLGFDVNAQTSDKNTLLHQACATGDSDMTEALQGADIMAKNGEGKTPLHLACGAGQKEIVTLLIQRSVDTSSKKDVEKFVNTADSSGNTPLHDAAAAGHPEIARVLIQHGAELNKTNTSGLTAIHLAIQQDRNDTVQLLLDQDASCHVKDSSGCTPLILACKHARKQAVFLLLEKDSSLVNEEDWAGRTALHEACSTGNADIVHLLLTQTHYIDVRSQDDSGRTALHTACMTGKEEAVRLLLNKSQDDCVNHQDVYDRTALHEACKAGNAKVVSLLLEKDQVTDIAIQDEQGCTALHEACKAGNAEIVSLLLHQDQDTDIAIQDEYGYTALHEACRSGSIKVVQLLLTVNADIINITDHDGYAALHLAAVGKRREHEQIVGTLLQHGKVNVNLKNGEGYTALHLAIIFNLQNIMKKLLADKLVNVNVEDNQGNTPLHFAVYHTDTYATRLLRESRKNVDLDIRNADGMTALDLANKFGRTDIVHTILDKV